MLFTPKNSQVIVLNGFSRGGTSIAWNLLFSHPDLCSPGDETGHLFYDYIFPNNSRLARKVLTTPKLHHSPIGWYFQSKLDKALFDWKMKTLNHPHEGTKFEGVHYTREEVKQSILCLKSVDLEINLTEAFMRAYPDSSYIGLMRDGYALCNGWMRRRRSADEAGRVYRKIGLEMIALENKYSNYRIFKFEDVCQDPFGMTEQMHRFCQLRPITWEKVRLKAKRVILANGCHDTRIGEENGYYWLDKEAIKDFIDPNINKRQQDQLSQEDLKAFERHARPVLEHFGYRKKTQLNLS